MPKVIGKKDKEFEQLKEAIAELQEKEKQRDSNFKPKHDFAEKTKAQNAQS